MPWPKGAKHTAETIAKRSASLITNGTRRKKPVVLEGLEYWRCGTCKIYKPTAEYYANGKTAAGISSACKSCHCESSLRTRDPEKARETTAAYLRRARAADPERFREKDRIASEKKRRTQWEKVAARSAVNSAVKRGELIKPTKCQSCGEEKRLAGHHDDYAKPLSVRWLCYGCHGKEHRISEFKKVKP